MIETYNWSNFYNALCKLGPQLLLGIDNSTLEMIEEVALSTDMFWSDGLQEILTENATNGDLRAGVLSILDKWRENVLQAIENDFSIELNWKNIIIDTTSPLIEELVEATQTTG
jgi:hypothetical protein